MMMIASTTNNSISVNPRGHCRWTIGTRWRTVVGPQGHSPIGRQGFPVIKRSAARGGRFKWNCPSQGPRREPLKLSHQLTIGAIRQILKCARIDILADEADGTIA